MSLLVEVITKSSGVIEVVEKGSQGRPGPQGEPYSFVGGEYGEVWSVLPEGEYGWRDPESDTKVVVFEDTEAEQYVLGSDEVQGIEAFVYATHPAVQVRDTDAGIRTLTIDLHKKAPRTRIFFNNVESVELSASSLFNARTYLLDKVHVPEHTVSILQEGVSEEFTTGGLYEIDAQNRWSADSTHMFFVGNDTGRIVVFDRTRDSWVVIQFGNPSVGAVVTSNKIDLMGNGILPSSYGNMTVSGNLEVIPSEYFTKCDPEEVNNTEQNKLIIGFAGTRQSGFIVT